jgi:hypothetical protein
MFQILVKQIGIDTDPDAISPDPLNFLLSIMKI